jgi:hypothetical protein
VEDGAFLPRGVFRGKEMIGILRTVGGRLKSLYLFSSILFIFGQWLLYPPLCLIFMFFFFASS